jgi:Protein of unknown function (DUF2612)
MALVAALCQGSVDQQNQLLNFSDIFDINEAVGDQLDKLGAWVGVSRNLNQVILGVSTLPDTQYAVFLKLFIAMNSWDGTVPGIYTIWDTLFAPQGSILVQDNQDMSMAIVFQNPPTDLLTLAILTQGYWLLRPAGVLMVGFFEPSVPGDPLFGFDVENSTISGFDVGAFVIAVVA